MLKEKLLEKISGVVSELCLESNYGIRKDVFEALQLAEKKEEERLAKLVLGKLIENIKIAEAEKVPVCQDTGVAEVFVEVGKGVSIQGDLLEEAISRGVREGYKGGYLRKSMVDDPLFLRQNTQDNTPALIHFQFNSSFRDRIRITLFPKGFGSENVGKVAMLTPDEGRRGVKRFILKVVKQAGANPCPPIILGVGIGGTMQTCIFLAKKALLRPLEARNPTANYALLEEELLREINQLKIGVQGLGGLTTCLGVNIEHFATHMAGLPVGVNISCYALREATRVLNV